jgi:L-lactate permease
VLAATATGLLGREAEIVRAIVPPVAISLAILILVGAVYG